MLDQPYEATTIAKWFIAFATENDADRSHLKIQKLLYFAQGHYLGIHNRPLFADEIQAWAHGPVVAGVYEEFREFGSADVNLLDSDVFKFDDVDEDVTEFLLDIWGAYAKYGAWQLRNMTHEQMPWKQCFVEGQMGTVIPVELLKQQFARA